MVDSDRPSYEGVSIHAAVFMGFGLIFGLWLFAWFQLSLRINDAQTRAAVINTRYMAAQDTLSSVRTQVLIGSVALRDALLNPNQRNVDGYKSQLEQVYRSIDDLLAGYVPVSDSPEHQQQFRTLREELNTFRATMLEVLATDSARWHDEAGKLLSLRVTPRRDIVLAVSEGVQALNRTGYAQQQSEIAGVYRAEQRELWQLLGLALLIGASIAVLAVIYAGRLEHRLKKQMAKGSVLSRELQELSENLVNAQEKERRLIARELHDEIGQALTAIKVELAYVERAINHVAVSGDLLVNVRSITDTALTQVRNLSYLLHPAALDELGLAAAVDSYVNRFSKRQNIDARFCQNISGQRLLADIETAAYRIVQEGLTNVAKHAHATACEVQLLLTGDTLKIVVEDNGAGFSKVKSFSKRGTGLGLIGIRERALQLGGTARFESAAGGGASLEVELPATLREDETEDLDTVPDPTAA
jgi:signal transduction histidine kinase